MAQDGSPAVAALERHFARHDADLVAVYLFGSLARRQGRADSDVDVGLLFREAPPPTLAGPQHRIEEELERLLGRPAQAIALNDAPVDLIHRVLRDGVLVHEGDPSARIRFEVAARREYLDLLPLLRLYRRGEASAA